MASVLTITEAKCAVNFVNLWLRLTPEAKSHLLFTSPQYASVLKPRQNNKNNRGQKPLLHW